jgi:hypothetical protein
MHAAIIDASLDAIPITFDETAGSLIISGCRAARHICFINKTDNVLAFSIGSFIAAPTSSVTTNRNQGFVPPQASTSLDHILISNDTRVYIRSADGSSISAGAVYAFAWSL